MALAEQVGEPRIAVLALGEPGRRCTAMQGDYATGQRQRRRRPCDRAREIGDAWAEALVAAPPGEECRAAG